MAFETMKNYQRGGVVDTLRIARPNIIALAHYIAHKAGIPDVRMQFTPGMAAHRQGLAVDIQPGKGNKEAMNRLQKVVEDLDWGYWGVRYAAVNKTEYGGSWGGKERKRPQTMFYGTPGKNDGYHLNHLHIDVIPTAQVRDWKNLVKGESTITPTAPSKAVLSILADLGYANVKEAQKDLGLVEDGIAGPITTEALEKEMSKLDEILDKVTKTNHAVGRIEPVVRALGGLKPGDDISAEDIAQIKRRSEQTNAAVGRIEKVVGTYGQAKGA